MYLSSRICLLSAFVLSILSIAVCAATGNHSLILLKTGELLEGAIESPSITIEMENHVRVIPLKEIRSIFSGAPATRHEKERLETGLFTIVGGDQENALIGAEQRVSSMTRPLQAFGSYSG